MKRRILSILLSLVMVVTMMPMMAFAETEDETPIGEIWQIGATDGDSVQAKLTDTYLEITGNGNMKNFTAETQPWKDKGVASVYIDDAVTNIGDYAFYGCTQLVYVDMSSNVTYIGENAFNGAFNGFASTTSIELPATVTTIGSSAFSGCTKIKRIIVQSSTPATIGNGVFESTAKLIVPLASLQTYKTSWNAYASAITSVCTVNKSSYTGGSVTVSPSTIYAGDTVTLCAYPDTNYDLTSLSVSYNDGQDTCILSEPTVYTNYTEYTFQMPSDNVNVNAIFTRTGDVDPTPTTYICSINDRKYTSLEAAVKKVRNNQTITLLADSAENIRINRAVRFTINENGYRNHSIISCGTFYVIDIHASPDNASLVIYEVTLQTDSTELINKVINRVLNAAEPLLRVVTRVSGFVSRVNETISYLFKKLF